MEISPDNIIFWQCKFIKINATIVFTWLIMFILVMVSWLITRNLKVKPQISRWQNILEIIIDTINQQIREVSQQEPSQYLPFVGTLFLFIVVANMLTIVPGYEPPTGSLSTTAGLALCVFVAVPLFGILNRGLLGYLRNYIQPTPLMLPFNIISEFSRTLALAVRLFGNIMSGSMLVAILVSLVPLFFPILIRLLGLLIGIIQAYIFAILAMVYIASATRVYRRTEVGD
ncbi:MULTISPECIES: F0F1 ATP synthase subunit A [Cyanophyceae]|uniref:F0F1 ATP synthase subunit A n=1 Tax=Cyanophyceae TaxID=3028117 RepID=UPI00232DA243|nr:MULTISPECIES: F0F1 ATP synthase subunit A [Cyanophyceae]MDB9356963.1 F0F1 ATP synthase subunit A [Nodularia spumigena CS-587/03]MDB9339406.1 F0F1 ATP synthase subunit A [Nodularia spumigena CS-589/07]MDB9348268.1 F0F1 ATP synthase subunit A [Nodularia spumigena CS-588/01]MDB9353204.1 F0F1 ATP synthase subunit A [Nodularia spumigena CS-588/05]MDB9401296.1 F0F1 ATP synthase subunit A [Microcystis aeruginosa CS-567/02-A1]